MESTTQEIMKKYDQEISLLTLQVNKFKSYVKPADIFLVNVVSIII